MKKASKKDVAFIKTTLSERYADAVSELRYTSLYELLVAVMLSAQCTDKRVNIITPNLFAAYPNTKKLALADIDELKALINSCSFFNNKAANLIKMARSVEENFGGMIPLDEASLISLAGVGQKTAHVVMIEHTGANVMAVDTHVFRVSHRLGLSVAKTPSATELDLSKKFQTNLHVLHQAMVLFGRYTCKAKNPLCEECFLSSVCKSKESFKAG
ncbi:MAG: endonuclease III [Sulfurospirillum sp.]|nr:endonuclease III [Sulfurospirillum sp.]